ncbi:hypothetical protein M3Y96_00686800 [Aphelenchoides besseyi]|nr:hypothetical protein M3Y96_00686800 [Aphelenchoides besseyi]
MVCLLFLLLIFNNLPLILSAPIVSNTTSLQMTSRKANEEMQTFPIDSTNATIEITTMTWEVVNCTIDDFDSYEDELLFEAPEKAPESLSFGVMLFTFTIIVVMLIMLLRLVVSFKPLNYRVVSNE